MSWNLQILKDEVEETHGEAQRELLIPCLESIVDRQHYANYHFQDFESLLKEFLSSRSEVDQLFRLVIGSDLNERNEWHICRKKAEANIVGCLQSMHATSDILGHVIYYALNMNQNSLLRLSDMKISIYSVSKKISSVPKYSDLSDCVNKLTTHTDFRYLSDIVNHSKHRSVIGTSFTVNVHEDSGRPHGIEFHSFNYNDRNHNRRWVDTYLKSEHTRQLSLIIKVGNEINRLVHMGVINNNQY